MQTGSNARGYTVMHALSIVRWPVSGLNSLRLGAELEQTGLFEIKKKFENPRVDSIEFVTLSCHSSLANNVQNCLKWNSTWIGGLRSALNLIFVIFNNNKLVRINNECKLKNKILVSVCHVWWQEKMVYFTCLVNHFRAQARYARGCHMFVSVINKSLCAWVFSKSKLFK